MKATPKLLFSSVSLLFSVFAVLFVFGCTNQPKETASSARSQASQSSAVAVAKLRETEGSYTAQLLRAPAVPPPIGTQFDGPQKVIVHMESTERIMKLGDGTEYTFWTFNDMVPGPMIRVQEGDEVEVHFANHPDSILPHNVDFHAVTGPGGGAEASLTSPGRETVFSFRALHPGLYIYHCAAPPVPLHIANGMYGLILVEPKGGFKKVDKEYYIVQSEFYTQGKYGDEGLQAFDQEKAMAENPTYVLFNGSDGALAGANAITAEVGDTVRLFVGNGGPNLTSSFHVIGEIFDNVYIEGGSVVNHNVQTTTIPAGGAVIVEFTVDVPGVYNIVDHAIFRAFNKGALGQLVVSGEENPTVFSGQVSNKEWEPAADYVNPGLELRVNDPDDSENTDDAEDL